MVNDFNEVHNRYYTYDILSYRPHEKINIICPIHGSFDMTATGHLSGYGCFVCQITDQEIYDKIYKVKTNDMINRFLQVHGNRFDYSKVILGLNENVDIVCSDHGIFSQRAVDHARGVNCPECGMNSRKNKLQHSTNQFIDKANEIHNFRYDYSMAEYKGNAAKVEIICDKHGSFWQIPTNHIDKNAGCPRCKNRWRLQNKWLDAIGLPNGSEYRQVKLANDGIINGKKKLVADGFDPSTNTIYEFFGDYHHGNPKFYTGNEIHCYNKKLLSDLFNKTEDRLRYLYLKGYKIVYIWENQFNNKSLGYEYVLGESLRLD